MDAKEEKNFELIAKIWTNYLGMEVNAQDVASMMVLLKIARTRNGSGPNTFKDASWYAESAAEICERIKGPRKGCKTCEYDQYRWHKDTEEAWQKSCDTYEAHCKDCRINGYINYIPKIELINKEEIEL